MHYSHVVQCQFLYQYIMRWTDTDTVGIRRHSSRLDVDKMKNEPIPLHVSLSVKVQNLSLDVEHYSTFPYSS